MEKTLQCLICKKRFKHLGSHIWHGHKITAREYKSEFGLPFRMSLIGSEVKRKKQEHFEENRDKYVKQLLKAGKNHQFRKGDGKGRSRRISEYERNKFIERIKKVNENRKGKLEQCPVCKMKFNHLQSHLFNAHQLLKIN